MREHAIEKAQRACKGRADRLGELALNAKKRAKAPWVLHTAWPRLSRKAGARKK